MQQKKTIIGYSKAFWSGITTVELAKVIDKTIRQDINGLIIVSGNPKINKFDLLKLFNIIFRDSSINIIENSKYLVDKSMSSSRNDFNYITPSYQNMIIEMKEWILKYNHLYKHYKTK
jgi:dTDP-4-dehydrorhamnose reductase